MCTQRIDHSLQTAVRAAPCSTWTKTPVSVWTVRRRWCWTRLTAVWISVSLPRSTDPAVLRHADPQHRRPGPALATPVLVSGHEHVAAATPDSLRQSYIVTEAEHKLNILWSFVKAHRRKKIVVFLASCKQTKYYHEVFQRLKPGVSVSALYGSLHQLRRMAVYDQFCAKQQAVLFATDIAARGLDFPNVDWVLQLDCPEDATTYTHR